LEPLQTSHNINSIHSIHVHRRNADRTKRRDQKCNIVQFYALLKSDRIWTLQRKVLSLKTNLNRMGGWFGSSSTNAVVSSAANGKAEAKVKIPVPIWEIVLICVIVVIGFYVAKRACEHYTNKYTDARITRARTKKNKPIKRGIFRVGHGTNIFDPSKRKKTSKEHYIFAYI
jgi:hypothetical protein